MLSYPAYRIECHSQWSAFLDPFSLLGIVDNRLMILLMPDATISTIAPESKVPPNVKKTDRCYCSI